MSNAEIAIFAELSRRRLTKGLVTQHPIAFDFELDRVHGTVVDFQWYRFLYDVFIDGEYVHSKGRQQEKDELIIKALARRGHLVERFRYKAPLSLERKKEICDSIGSTLKVLGY